MFSPIDQQKLRAACSVNKHAGLNNPNLDRVIRELMEAKPWMFHSESSLDSRRFYHEPKTRIPMMSYVEAYK